MIWQDIPPYVTYATIPKRNFSIRPVGTPRHQRPREHPSRSVPEVWRKCGGGKRWFGFYPAVEATKNTGGVGFYIYFPVVVRKRFSAISPSRMGDTDISSARLICA